MAQQERLKAEYKWIWLGWIILSTYCKSGWALQGYQNTQQGLCTTQVTVEKSRIVLTHAYTTHKVPTQCEDDYNYNDYYDTCWKTGGSWKTKPKTEWYTDYEDRTVCCEGYTLENDECKPTCIPDCESQHGYCSEVNVCTCFKGYEKNSSNICTPICSRQCQNGICTAPETCTCKQGYIYDHKDSYSCVPHCPEECVNSNCTKPGFCECHEGHEKGIDQQNLCKPVCSNCTNADCVNPEVCECWDGYNNYTLNHCLPICSSCHYGKCDYPEVCSCWDGYDNPSGDNSRCVPVCDEECVNSLCTAPDKCTCLEGFANVTGEWNKCSPHCSKQCMNGICVNPEECECPNGFELNEHDRYSCLPFCSKCVNGLCTAPEFCNCLWGFKPSENASTCSEASSSKSQCLFYSEFLVSSYPEKSCLDVSIKSQHRLINITKCPFLHMIFTKLYSEFSNIVDLVTIELNCSVNSIKYESEFEITCITDKIMNNYYEDNFYDGATFLTIEPANNFKAHTDSVVFNFTHSTTETKSKQLNTEMPQLSYVNNRTSHEVYRINKTKRIINELRVDNTMYIKKHGVLMQYFHNVSELQLPTDWCFCSSQLSRSSCEGEFRMKLYTCGCSYIQGRSYVYLRGESDGFSVLTKFGIVLLILTVLGIGGFIYYYKRSKKTLLNSIVRELETGVMYVRSKLKTNDDKGEDSFDETEVIDITSVE